MKKTTRKATLNPTPEIVVQETSLEARSSEPAASPADPPAPEPCPVTGVLIQGGPTLEEYVAAGYSAENYPPAGYAARTTKAIHLNPMGQPIEYKPLQFCQPPKAGQLRP